MNKAAIKAQIDNISQDLAKAEAKLAKLRAAKAHLDGVTVAFEYIPQGAGSIKGAYQLSGKPYDTMAEDEEDLVTRAKKQMALKKDVVSGALATAIGIESAKVSSFTGQITTLNVQLAMAKD